jgi:pyruvate-ferredoxin/flavodoxin oxidoreductase
MSYGNVYVAQVAMGANDAQTLKAFLEAEAHDGPSLIIAYSHCIAHGYDLRFGLDQQKKAVLSGHWPLFRFDAHTGCLSLDSKPPSIPLSEYLYGETRYRMLAQTRPDDARELLDEETKYVTARYRQLETLAASGGAHERE